MRVCECVYRYTIPVSSVEFLSWLSVQWLRLVTCAAFFAGILTWYIFMIQMACAPPPPATHAHTRTHTHIHTRTRIYILMKRASPY